MHLVDRVFERFVALYGAHKFKAMFEHDDNAIMPAKEAWENFLHSCKPDVLRKVMDELPFMKREWPPNLSEFIGMCRDFDRVEQRVNIPLPAPRHITKEGEETLRRMKEMLKSKVVR